ncbi:hypothetical protein LTR37_017297 [Vermiconidia calcicola]|uniref:Uncharacterized protein n=1 Tax=Vermiconidia calcicola TaxID=1690605 RepID=A0ACC3MLX8_9PEZI|nr:hypothetical protein LTR37_017297 [Vermiconidia calcicola]
MSFGFSPSDIVTLISLTSKAYRGWKHACGEYSEITGSLDSLSIVLQRIEREASKPGSVLKRTAQDMQDLGDVLANCEPTIRELHSIVVRYKSMGSSRQKNWDRLQLGFKNLGDLKSKLTQHVTLVSAYLDVVGLGMLGKIERDVSALPQQILNTVNGLVAEIRAGRREGSVMTTYEDDEKDVWRQFRRELIGDGMRSSMIHKYKPLIRKYLRERAERGDLEEQPVEDVLEAPYHSSSSITRQGVDVDSLIEISREAPERDDSLTPTPHEESEQIAQLVEERQQAGQELKTRSAAAEGSAWLSIHEDAKQYIYDFSRDSVRQGQSKDSPDENMANGTKQAKGERKTRYAAVQSMDEDAKQYISNISRDLDRQIQSKASPDENVANGTKQAKRDRKKRIAAGEWMLEDAKQYIVDFSKDLDQQKRAQPDKEDDGCSPTGEPDLAPSFTRNNDLRRLVLSKEEGDLLSGKAPQFLSPDYIPTVTTPSTAYDIGAPPENSKVARAEAACIIPEDISDDKRTFHFSSGGGGGGGGRPPLHIDQGRFKFQGDEQLPKPRDFVGRPKRYRAGRRSSVPLDLAAFE